MRRSRYGQVVVLALVVVCLALAMRVDARQCKYGLLEQLLANVSSPPFLTSDFGNAHCKISSQGVEVSSSRHVALLNDPAAITATAFFQKLQSQQKGQLLLQAARLQLYGDGPTSPNISAAKRLLHVSAGEFGNPDAQFLLGALTTLEDDTPAQSVLYQYFGARGGSVAASMVLGYRHLYGYQVPKSCEASLRYYKFAADRVISLQSSERPIQVFSSPEPFRLTDDASKKKPGRDDEDAHRVEYLRQKALGSSDPVLLEKAASVVLFSDLPHVTTASSTSHNAEPEYARTLEAKALLDRAVNLGSFSAKALLGHVYAYGLGGFHPNVPKAIRLYEEALNESAIANQTSAEAANGLGLIYFNGVGDTHIDYERAMRLFQVSARLGHADGVYNTGVLLSKSHPQRAQEYLEASAHVGHLKAQFKLARLKEKERFNGIKQSRKQAADSSHVGSCEEIVKLYKQVAENAHEGKELLESAAAVFLFANDRDHALKLYLLAAEMGYEVAASNAAWLLERQGKLSSSDSKLYQELVRRGLAQDSPDAHVRYGDLLYEERNFALAMFQYELADYLSHGKHGRALFNMAFMHEKGLGVASKSLETASMYYELVARVKPAMLEVVWLIRLKLKVQIHIERLAEKMWSMQNQICDVLGLLSLRYQEKHGATDAEDTTKDKPANASSTGFADESYQVDLALPLASESQDRDVQDGVTFASAMRFKAESKLQLEILRSLRQQFTVDFWIKIQSSDHEDSSRRTYMVLLDVQDSFQLELMRSDSEKNEWVVQFRTMSTLFVFPNGKLCDDKWSHVTLVVGAARGDSSDDSGPTIALFMNGELRHQHEYQSHLHHEPYSSGGVTQRILSIGSSLTRSASPAQSSQFIGSLMNFRIWRTMETGPSIRTLMLTQQHQLSAQSQQDLFVQLQFQIQRDSGAAKIPLERTTSTLAANIAIYAAYNIDPEIVQFPPEEMTKTGESQKNGT